MAFFRVKLQEIRKSADYVCYLYCIEANMDKYLKALCGRNVIYFWKGKVYSSSKMYLKTVYQAGLCHLARKTKLPLKVLKC